MSDASIENSRLIQAERSLILKVSSSWPAPGCSRDAGERRAAAVRPARLGSLWAVLLVADAGRKCGRRLSGGGLGDHVRSEELAVVGHHREGLGHLAEAPLCPLVGELDQRTSFVGGNGGYAG